MAANCPNTRLVLGGYSLGAAVTDVVVAVPSPIFGYDNPLPLGMDSHIAAVALFGNGTRKVLGPVSALSPLYGDKTIDLCTADDPICNNNLDPNTWVDNGPSHQYAAYVGAGLVDQAAANRLDLRQAAPGPPDPKAAAATVDQTNAVADDAPWVGDWTAGDLGAESAAPSAAVEPLQNDLLKGWYVFEASADEAVIRHIDDPLAQCDPLKCLHQPRLLAPLAKGHASAFLEQALDGLLVQAQAGAPVGQGGGVARIVL
jgi:hypothetical protein